MKNVIPEQIKDIPWGWTSRTDIDGMQYVTDHPGKVKMPSLIDYFNWSRWHFRNGPSFLFDNWYCTTNMKSILTTYTRFMSFEDAIVEMDQDDLYRITSEFITWNVALLELAPVGIDMFIVGDDLASQRAPFMSPEMYEDKYIPHLKRLFDAIMGQPNGELIEPAFHSCGDIYKLLDLLITLPIEYIHFQKVGRMRKFNTGDLLKRADGSCVTMWENEDPFMGTRGEGKVR
jgi:hypothetical protein